MSAQTTAWVWRHSRSTGMARLVLLAIADQVDVEGVTWDAGVRMATIAAMVGGPDPASQPDLRSVRRALRELESSGELEVVTRPGRGRASIYRLTAYRRQIGADPAGKPDTGVRVTGGKPDTHVRVNKPEKADTRVRVNEENPDTGVRVTEAENPDTGVRVNEEKPDTGVRVSDPEKADTGVRVTEEKPDICGTKNRTLGSGPIDVPTTVPTTTTTTPDSSPSLPPTESGPLTRRLTDQQRAVERVEAAFQFAQVEPPSPKRIVGAIRNMGGFDRIEELMALVRRLAAAGELSEKRLFSAVATARIRDRAADRRLGRGAGSTVSSPPAASAPADAARRRRLEEIQEASRAAD